MNDFTLSPTLGRCSQKYTFQPALLTQCCTVLLILREGYVAEAHLVDVVQHRRAHHLPAHTFDVVCSLQTAWQGLQYLYNICAQVVSHTAKPCEGRVDGREHRCCAVRGASTPLVGHHALELNLTMYLACTSVLSAIVDGYRDLLTPLRTLLRL